MHRSPPILALYATPTPHTPLLAAAATSPAHRVPCLEKEKSWREREKKSHKEESQKLQLSYSHIMQGNHNNQPSSESNWL